MRWGEICVACGCGPRHRNTTRATLIHCVVGVSSRQDHVHCASAPTLHQVTGSDDCFPVHHSFHISIKHCICVLHTRGPGSLVALLHLTVVCYIPAPAPLHSMLTFVRPRMKSVQQKLTVFLFVNSLSFVSSFLETSIPNSDNADLCIGVWPVLPNALAVTTTKGRKFLITCSPDVDTRLDALGMGMGLAMSASASASQQQLGVSVITCDASPATPLRPSQPQHTPLTPRTPFTAATPVPPSPSAVSRLWGAVFGTSTPSREPVREHPHVLRLISSDTLPHAGAERTTTARVHVLTERHLECWYLSMDGHYSLDWSCNWAVPESKSNTKLLALDMCVLTSGVVSASSPFQPNDATFVVLFRVMDHFGGASQLAFGVARVQDSNPPGDGNGVTWNSVVPTFDAAGLGFDLLVHGDIHLASVPAPQHSHSLSVVHIYQHETPILAIASLPLDSSEITAQRAHLQPLQLKLPADCKISHVWCVGAGGAGEGCEVLSPEYGIAALAPSHLLAKRLKTSAQVVMTPQQQFIAQVLERQGGEGVVREMASAANQQPHPDLLRRWLPPLISSLAFQMPRSVTDWTGPDVTAVLTGLGLSTAVIQRCCGGGLPDSGIALLDIVHTAYTIHGPSLDLLKSHPDFVTFVVDTVTLETQIAMAAQTELEAKLREHHAMIDFLESINFFRSRQYMTHAMQLLSQGHKLTALHALRKFENELRIEHETARWGDIFSVPEALSTIQELCARKVDTSETMSIHDTFFSNVTGFDDVFAFEWSDMMRPAPASRVFVLSVIANEILRSIQRYVTRTDTKLKQLHGTYEQQLEHTPEFGMQLAREASCAWWFCSQNVCDRITNLTVGTLQAIFHEQRPEVRAKHALQLLSLCDSFLGLLNATRDFIGTHQAKVMSHEWSDGLLSACSRALSMSRVASFTQLEEVAKSHAAYGFLAKYCLANSCTLIMEVVNTRDLSSSNTLEEASKQHVIDAVIQSVLAVVAKNDFLGEPFPVEEDDMEVEMTAGMAGQWQVHVTLRVDGLWPVDCTHLNELQRLISQSHSLTVPCLQSVVSTSPKREELRDLLLHSTLQHIAPPSYLARFSFVREVLDLYTTTGPFFSPATVFSLEVADEVVMAYLDGDANHDIKPRNDLCWLFELMRGKMKSAKRRIDMEVQSPSLDVRASKLMTSISMLADYASEP
eukprot:c12656_g1_i2.p1 GENE.c12656_g1_i2~~c12656_g1_i2.p1  ORF type:complete len:1181 (-),score=273.29 c12656_g1_i2:55-3597(-)